MLSHLRHVRTRNSWGLWPRPSGSNTTGSAGPAPPRRARPRQKEVHPHWLGDRGRDGCHACSQHVGLISVVDFCGRASRATHGRTASCHARGPSAPPFAARKRGANFRADQPRHPLLGLPPLNHPAQSAQHGPIWVFQPRSRRAKTSRICANVAARRSARRWVSTSSGRRALPRMTVSNTTMTVDASSSARAGGGRERRRATWIGAGPIPTRSRRSWWTSCPSALWPSWSWSWSLRPCSPARRRSSAARRTTDPTCPVR